MASATTVNAEDAGPGLDEVLALVEQGQEVLIAKGGRAVARVSACQPPARREVRLGAARGLVTFLPGWDAPLTEQELAEWCDAPLTVEPHDESAHG